MRNSISKKGLVIGIILLFFGAGVFPSVCGKLVTLNTNDNTLNNSTGKMTLIIISRINDKRIYNENNVSFNNLIGYIMMLVDGKYSDSTLIIGSPLGFAYSTKIGIFSEHVVCAVFFNCYFP